ncbi:FAD dependent oxidoreductase [Kalaharituber pfeilii]|nr:FAD dependent oxidoreductase [Kalaharituber pfeilii]
MPSQTKAPPLIIIGGGVMGVSTAYFLSLRNPDREIHIIESSPSIFPSASARAAGFIAKDWFSSSLADLGILSFDLHKKLAELHGGREKWGYSGSIGLSLITKPTVNGIISKPRGESWLFQGTSRAEVASKSGGSVDGTCTPVETAVAVTDSADIPPWLSISSQPQVEVISRPDSTAQIDPLKFCNFLLGECIARGVHLHLSTHVTNVHEHPDTGLLSSVDLSTAITVPCSQILITAGVWTPQVLHTLFPNISSLCPVLNVSSLAGYSIVYRTPRISAEAQKPEDSPSVCHAIFTTDEKSGFSPEMFSRMPNFDIYLAGLNSTSIPFPTIASGVPVPELNDPSIVRLAKIGKQLISTAPGEELEIIKTGLCHRPVLPDGKPIMGRIPDELLGWPSSTNSPPSPDPRRGSGSSPNSPSHPPMPPHGVYTCVGHGPWGITLSTGCGLVMAEILEGSRKMSADVRLLSVEHAWELL